MLFKNPILKDAVIARRVRARALARSKRIEFASLFPPKTCFQVDNGNGLATTGSRIDRTWPKNGQNTLVQRSSPPALHAPDVLNVALVPLVIAPSCSSRFDARTDVTHQMSRGRVYTRFQRIVANHRLWKRAETIAGEPSRSIGRGFGSRTRGLRVDFQRGLERVWIGSMGDRTGQGYFVFFLFWVFNPLSLRSFLFSSAFPPCFESLTPRRVEIVSHTMRIIIKRFVRNINILFVI